MFQKIVPNKLKFLLPALAIIIIISLLVFSPSFNLHLAGDDYQSLWKYRMYESGLNNSDWSKLGYFLSDYGPQDTFMHIIYNFVGLQPIYYYLISYILRIGASLSLILLVYNVTKNKTAAFISALFFSVTTSGLESTNWVFNMPVYLSITLLSLFLIFYLKLRERFNRIDFIFCFGFFALTLMAMPIRMIFLPGLILLLEFLFYINSSSRTSFRKTLQTIIFLGLITYVFFSFSHIGHTIGVSHDFYKTTENLWSSNLERFLSETLELIREHKYQYFLYIVAQIGAIVFPNNLIRPKWQILTSNQYFLITILSLLTIYIVVKFLSMSYKDIKQSVFKLMLTILILWGLFVWGAFNYWKFFTYYTSIFVTMLVGGYTLIIVLTLLINTKKTKKTYVGLMLGITILILSFIQYWLRNPLMVQSTFNRYLIVPGVGLSILIGFIIAGSQNKFPVTLLSVCLIGIHAIGSFYYLYKSSLYRSINHTEEIRYSIPDIFTEENLKKPIVFYFEPEGSPFLYHSFLFGFPVIMAVQYDFLDYFNLAYTDNWSEVVSAYKTGESLKRFGVTNQEPVAIENVYSYTLYGYDLYDTTAQTRQKLLNIQD